MSRVRSALAVVTLALVALPLAACSEDIGEKIAEKAIENQLGDDAGVDIDADGQNVTVDDGKGNSYTSGSQLPDDFPGDVPLIEGTVIAGVSLDEAGRKAWNISIQVDGDADAALEEAKELLEGAGFESTTQVRGAFSGGQLANDAYDIVLVGYGDPSAGTAVIGYTVSAPAS